MPRFGWMGASLALALGGWLAACGGDDGPAPTGGDLGGTDGGGPGGGGGGDHGAGCPGEVESELLRITNEERIGRGGEALSCDEKLTRAAFLHSQDMCDQGYFSHDSADGRSFTDRITAQGATYRAAGENIAQGQRTPSDVHASWMNSEGHRANILSSRFRRIGIGYAPCDGRPFWTQVFTD